MRWVFSPLSVQLFGVSQSFGVLLGGVLEGMIKILTFFNLADIQYCTLLVVFIKSYINLRTYRNPTQLALQCKGILIQSYFIFFDVLLF